MIQNVELHASRERWQHLQAARTREHLGMSDFVRQSAVARFPLRVANLAYQMNKLIEAVERNAESPSKEVADALAYMEKQIRDCFLEDFGHELIAE